MMADHDEGVDGISLLFSLFSEKQSVLGKRYLNRSPPVGRNVGARDGYVLGIAQHTRTGVGLI